MTTENERVRAAIEVMRRHPELDAYLRKTAEMRAGVGGTPMGSFYPDKTPDQVLADLKTVAWQPYTHPAIMEGCTAFVSPLPGRMGMIDLSTVPGDTPVTLEDPKNTGKVSAVLEAWRLPSVDVLKTDFTVIILGPNDKPPEAEIVFTFHPGSPVRPSLVPRGDIKAAHVTAKESIQMGLALAKLSY